MKSSTMFQDFFNELDAMQVSPINSPSPGEGEGGGPTDDVGGGQPNDEGGGGKTDDEDNNPTDDVGGGQPNDKGGGGKTDDEDGSGLTGDAGSGVTDNGSAPIAPTSEANGVDAVMPVEAGGSESDDSGDESSFMLAVPRSTSILREQECIETSCPNKTTLGPRCNACTIRELKVEVKESSIPNAGLGLFAAEDLPGDYIIDEYVGTIKNTADIGEESGYGVYINEGSKVIDAEVSTSCVARFANDVRGTKIKPHCLLVLGSDIVEMVKDFREKYGDAAKEVAKSKKKKKPSPIYDLVMENFDSQILNADERVFLITRRFVKKGTELLTDYGSKYHEKEITPEELRQNQLDFLSQNDNDPEESFLSFLEKHNFPEYEIYSTGAGHPPLLNLDFISRHSSNNWDVIWVVDDNKLMPVVDDHIYHLKFKFAKETKQLLWTLQIKFESSDASKKAEGRDMADEHSKAINWGIEHALYLNISNNKINAVITPSLLLDQTRLKLLDLGNTDISDETGAEVVTNIADRPHKTRPSFTLLLHDTKVGAKTATAIDAGLEKRPTTFVKLDLSRTAMNADDLKKIAPRTRSLKTLILDGFEEKINCDSWRSIVQLLFTKKELTDTEIPVEKLKKELSKLSTIVPETPEAVLFIKTYCSPSSLEHLSLGDNKLDKTVLGPLEKYIAFELAPSLERLDLRNVSVSDFTLLVKYPKGIRHLSIAHNKINSDTFRILAKKTLNKTNKLNFIDISGVATSKNQGYLETYLKAQLLVAPVVPTLIMQRITLTNDMVTTLLRAADLSDARWLIFVNSEKKKGKKTKGEKPSELVVDLKYCKYPSDESFLQLCHAHNKYQSVHFLNLHNHDEDFQARKKQLMNARISRLEKLRKKIGIQKELSNKLENEAKAKKAKDEAKAQTLLAEMRKGPNKTLRAYNDQELNKLRSDTSSEDAGKQPFVDEEFKTTENVVDEETLINDYESMRGKSQIIKNEVDRNAMERIKKYKDKIDDLKELLKESPATYDTYDIEEIKKIRKKFEQMDVDKKTDADHIKWEKITDADHIEWEKKYTKDLILETFAKLRTLSTSLEEAEFLGKELQNESNSSGKNATSDREKGTEYILRNSLDSDVNYFNLVLDLDEIHPKLTPKETLFYQNQLKFAEKVRASKEMKLGLSSVASVQSPDTAAAQTPSRFSLHNPSKRPRDPSFLPSSSEPSQKRGVGQP